jgi:hypothetical protein
LNDEDKLAIAAPLRRETTLSIKAIAARVRLGQTIAKRRFLKETRRRRLTNDRE